MPFNRSQAPVQPAASSVVDEPARESLPTLPPSSVRLAALADRFVVEQRIGAGGMAEVFRATEKKNGTRVAIKMPRGRDRQVWARFEREAAMLIALDHDGIVKHIAEGRAANGKPFLAMEWLEGEDLAQRLRRGPLSVDETLVIGERIAIALAAASASGVVHRDVKPSNIFLRNGAVEGATLIDFGIARRMLDAGATFSLTRTGMLLGTLGYMAPEQALGAKTAGTRADVFSLGCVLFECLTGQRAFGGSHAIEVLANLLTLDVPAPRAINADVPPALDALVRRMLARDPDERPLDCNEVAADLARVRARVADGSREVRWGAWSAGLVAGLVAGGIVAGVVALRPRPDLSRPTSGAATSAPEPIATPSVVPNDVAASSASSPSATASSKASPPSPRRDRPRARSTAPSPTAPSPEAPGANADPFGSSRH